jgi:molecular chaperone DnaK
MPCTVTQTYTTSQDNQTALSLTVYEGENTTATRNTLLGETVAIHNLKPMPAGEASIEVTLTIDDNGILTMTARETQNSSNKVSADLNMAIQREFPIASRLKTDESDE